MKITDLINICIHNLLRHKSRTVLTVLGVVIGCCSVVIMISFGIGMKISQDAMLAQMGDLQIIEVYSQGNTKLNDSAIEKIAQIPNVISINPKMRIDDIAYDVKAGENDRYYVYWSNITGITKEAIDAFGYEIAEGEGFSQNSSGGTLEALCGKYFAYNLVDSQRPEGYNTINYWEYLYGNDSEDDDSSALPEPYLDPLKSSFKLILGYDGDESTEKAITVNFKIVGILENDYSKGYETEEGLIFKPDDLKKLIKQYNQANNIAQKEEPTYNEVYVKADEIENVAEVESQIKEMGFYTYSLESVREPMEKEVRQKQLMFAGLGIVSLFVAALGIMNTMIMAISERKKEIGLMKSLGCLINNVRIMFLMEAGFIGLIGGIIGAAFSLAASSIINIVSTEAEISNIQALYQVLFESTDRVSVIPPWLAVSAVFFSVFVGLVSGYYPAGKAVKTSVLDALRCE